MPFPLLPSPSSLLPPFFLHPSLFSPSPLPSPLPSSRLPPAFLPPSSRLPLFPLPPSSFFLFLPPARCWTGIRPSKTATRKASWSTASRIPWRFWTQPDRWEGGEERRSCDVERGREKRGGKRERRDGEGKSMLDTTGAVVYVVWCGVCVCVCYYSMQDTNICICVSFFLSLVPGFLLLLSFFLLVLRLSSFFLLPSSFFLLPAFCRTTSRRCDLDG